MDESHTLRVSPELDGVRVDKAIADLLGVSRSVARSLVDEGVTVDGRPARPNTRVRDGETIVAPQPPRIETLVAERVEFDVLFEDDHVVVVDKPAGVVVHPGSGRRFGTLAAGLLERYPEVEGVGAEGRWGLVHRLDKDTSGALLVARDQPAFESLASQLRSRRISRRYLALVNGVLKPPTGTIDAPIGRDPAVPTRRAIARDGKPARTHYEAISNYELRGCALARVTLETGRTHQIRVHFAAIGHPVVGDRVYGTGRDVVPTPRIFLHAAELTFAHPVTGETLTVESALPADLAGVLDTLEQGEDA